MKKYLFVADFTDVNKIRQQYQRIVYGSTEQEAYANGCKALVQSGHKFTASNCFVQEYEVPGVLAEVL